MSTVIIIMMGTAAVLEDVEIVTVGVIGGGVEESTADVGIEDSVVGRGLRAMEGNVVGRGLRGMEDDVVGRVFRGMEDDVVGRGFRDTNTA